MSADRTLIEARFKESIDAWVSIARPPGGFLRAVLRNDLMDAFRRGDDEALANMPHILAYLYERVPSECQGSREKEEMWPSILHERLKQERDAQPERGYVEQDRYDEAREMLLERLR